MTPILDKTKDEHEIPDRLFSYKQTMRAVKKVFAEQFETLKTRSEKEQQIIGDLLTVVEIELKKEIKSIK